MLFYERTDGRTSLVSLELFDVLYIVRVPIFSSLASALCLISPPTGVLATIGDEEGVEPQIEATLHS